MRILVGLDAAAVELGTAITAIAALAEGNQVAVADRLIAPELALGLRNAMPDREVVVVATGVVVEAAGPAEPRAIPELPSLRRLLDAGSLVICAAWGEPVAVDAAGMMRGVEASVDLDLTAALLARRLDAELLLLLDGRGRPGTVARADAACRFAEATGRRAAVGALAEAELVLSGQAGIQIGPAGGARAIA